MKNLEQQLLSEMVFSMKLFQITFQRNCSSLTKSTILKVLSFIFQMFGFLHKITTKSFIPKFTPRKSKGTKKLKIRLFNLFRPFPTLLSRKMNVISTYKLFCKLTEEKAWTSSGKSGTVKGFTANYGKFLIWSSKLICFSTNQFTHTTITKLHRITSTRYQNISLRQKQGTSWNWDWMKINFHIRRWKRKFYNKKIKFIWAKPSFTQFKTFRSENQDSTGFVINKFTKILK